MDLFEIPDDYKPEKPLTDAQMDEITNYLKSHPLFMKEAPQDISSNPHLVALHSLIDEAPEEIAYNLNTRASLKLKEKPQSPYHMKDAYTKYTEAIDLKCNNAQLNAKLHSNRAAINLKLKNYGKVIEDCKKAITFDPTYVKSYYRYTKALIALDRWEDALKIIQLIQHPQLKLIKKQILNKIEKTKLKYQDNKNKYNEIETYITSRKWKCVKRTQPLPQGVTIHLNQGKLSVPIVIIYPQFNQFDLIAKTTPVQKIKSHLQQLLKSALPWDAKHEYNIDSIVIFVQMSQGVLLTIPKQARLEQIYDKVILKQALQILIVSKLTNFYSQYIANHKLI